MTVRCAWTLIHCPAVSREGEREGTDRRGAAARHIQCPFQSDSESSDPIRVCKDKWWWLWCPVAVLEWLFEDIEGNRSMMKVVQMIHGKHRPSVTRACLKRKKKLFQCVLLWLLGDHGRIIRQTRFPNVSLRNGSLNATVNSALSKCSVRLGLRPRERTSHLESASFPVHI